MAVEQLFRKQQVLGSNPSVGATPRFVLRKTCCVVPTAFQGNLRRLPQRSDVGRPAN